MTLLALRGVACRRGGWMLFDALDLTLMAGGAAVVTGPNGVGKSSLIRLAAGLLRPAEGKVTAAPAALLDERAALDADVPLERALRFWIDVDRHALAAPAGAAVRVGDVEERSRPHQSAIAAQAGIHGATSSDESSPAEAPTPAFAGMKDGTPSAGWTVEEALATLDLTPLAQVPVRLLSTGQRRRAALARVAVSRARLWLLDEPANGLDALAVARLEAMVAAHRAAGGAVLVATHLPMALPDAQPIALGTAA